MSQDHLLWLDQHLQAFFHDLDQRIGRDNYILMLTADHGFADTPEWSKLQGRDAGRVPLTAISKAMEDALQMRFGAGPWVRSMSSSGYLFNEALIRERGLKPDDIYAVAQAAAKRVPGIADAFTRAQLAGSDTSDPNMVAMRKSWDPTRAAPLQVIVKPYWLATGRATGTSHGTPYEYDQHVPLLSWGPAWLGRGEVRERVAVVDIAPTLARILNLPAPAQAEGQPLPRPR